MNIGDNLIFQRDKFDRRNRVVVLDCARNQNGLFAVKIKPANGRSFWVKPDQLQPADVPARISDPDGFSVAERRLFDIVVGHGPLSTSAIAEIVNGDPNQKRKWTASVAGVIARRLTGRGKLKMQHSASAAIPFYIISVA